MSTDAKKYSSEFEELSLEIINEIFRGYDVQIKKTKKSKDGGYDAVVSIQHDGQINRIYFECKLRSKNLNFRDIAANTIIAFNEGAIALVIITNTNYTSQTSENLNEFCKKTILNVKILVGNEIRHFCETHKITVDETLEKLFVPHRTIGKTDYEILKIDFTRANIISQIIQKASIDFDEKKPFVVHALSEEYEMFHQHLHNGELVLLEGPMGVGKNTFIHYFSQHNDYHLISVEALVYKTSRQCLLEILMDMWGVYGLENMHSLTDVQVEEICDVIERKTTDADEKKNIHIIMNYLLSGDEDTSQVVEIFNNKICQYIIKSIQQHKYTKYLFYIKNIDYAINEVQVLLAYLSCLCIKSKIPCVIKRDITEFTFQENNVEALWLQQIKMDVFYKLELPIFNQTLADEYISLVIPDLADIYRKQIIQHVGCRMLSLKIFLEMAKKECGNSHILFMKYLKCFPARNLPATINFSFESYYKIAPNWFFAFYLCGFRIPIELLSEFSCFDTLFVAVELSKLGYVIIDDNYVSIASNLAKELLLDIIGTHKLQLYMYANNIQVDDCLFKSYDMIRAKIYESSRKKQQACEVWRSICCHAKRNRQYTSYIENATMLLLHSDYIEEKLDILTEILQIITIRKEINLPIADEYFSKFLELLPQLNKEDVSKYQARLDFYTSKKLFKNGEIMACRDLTKKYFDEKKPYTEGEWNAKLACMYALCIKELEGNESALKCFININNTYPESKTIKREYDSHVACMNLYINPTKSQKLYQSIIDSWERDPESVFELPFHEYGDKAMSDVCAKKLEVAQDSCESAISILESNGVLSELGRVYNIRGCLHLLSVNDKSAEHDFQEAISLLDISKYPIYSWRAHLNMAAILNRNNKLKWKDHLDVALYYYKKLYSQRFSSIFSTNSYTKSREFLSLVLIIRLLEKSNENNRINLLIDELNASSHKDELLYFSKNQIEDSAFVSNNRIFIMG